MSGGLRLFWALSSFLLLAAAVRAGDDKSSNAVPLAPPEAEIKPIAEFFHGSRVIDNYRWLEEGNSAATKKWVAEEMAYTRGILDPLPGRERIHQRLTELLSIGSVTPPVIAGKHYFYTRREGLQNQPVLYVRDTLEGSDRVLVDANHSPPMAPSPRLVPAQPKRASMSPTARRPADQKSPRCTSSKP